MLGFIISSKQELTITESSVWQRLNRFGRGDIIEP
jgi:hypothetical protein